MKNGLMLFFLFLAVAVLTACGPSEWESERSLGNAAEEDGDLEQAIEHYEKAIELKPTYKDAQTNLTDAKQKYETELEKKKKIEEGMKRLDEEEKKKAAEEAEKRAEKEAIVKAQQEAKNKKAQLKVDTVVAELISMGDGSIKDIRPTSGNDWIAVYVEVDNTWHLFSEDEQKYAAETIGPAVESAIIETGVTDYCDVHFVDANGNVVASPKTFGGYKIKS